VGGDSRITGGTDNFFIAGLSGVELPADSPMRRDSPRPPERRGPDYEQKYDWLSLCYDVYWQDGRVAMIGPPLRNFAPLVAAGNLRLDGVAAAGTTTLNFLNADLVLVPADRKPEQLAIDAGWFQASVPVQPSGTKVFAGRKVLCVLSRDNRLQWIADWAEFHVKAHGADAVLLYDNASTSYTTADLLASFRSIPGLAAAVVVPWPYKFGPPGNGNQDWDSQYAQCVMLEHGRRRFLADAAAMVNLDIDELVVTDDGVGLFEHLARAAEGALIYPGRWIRNVRNFHPWSIRHRNFRYYSTSDEPYPTKWTVVPSRLAETAEVGIHSIRHGMTPYADPAITFRHFRAISTNWKYPRTRREDYRSSCHKVDEALVRQMRAIDWIR